MKKDLAEFSKEIWALEEEVRPCYEKAFKVRTEPSAKITAFSATAMNELYGYDFYNFGK